MKVNNKNKGITLISLIITIIILIILATVVVLITFGENSLINRVKNAKYLHTEAAEKEQERLRQLEKEILFSSSSLLEQDINYTESLMSIANPDRGFYLPVEVKGTSSGFDYSGITSEIPKLKQANRSLIHLRINLGKLSSKVNGETDLDLSNQDLLDLNSMFGILRTNNIKTILRFAYTYLDENNKEPSFDKILKHIEQLKPVLEQNKDVITLVEAGFIGKWGEMHTSSYANTEYYNRLINALLDSVPDTITINVRTPSMYTNRFSNKPIDSSIGYNKSDEARVGIFNDGYLGNETDLGTYDNRETALNWMESHTKYTIFGGEVTVPTSTYNDITYAQEEMFRTHTTYLNYLWNNSITQEKWVNQIYNGPNKVYEGKTAQKYIEDHLGYRYVLKKSEISKQVKQGEQLLIGIKIENTGFANVVNKKNAKIILQKGTSYYITDVDIDVRSWNSNEMTSEKLVFRIPNNIEIGDWNLYLKIFDEDNSNYVIKFANDNIWDQYFKANYIGKVNIIEKNNSDEFGFKQEYTDSDTESTDVQIISSEKIIDGTITSVAEWREEELAYRSGSGATKLYLSADNEYLYIYVEDPNTQSGNGQNINLKFANRNSNADSDYKYTIQNNGLYVGGTPSEGTKKSSTIQSSMSTGYECKILLSDLDLTGLQDIRKINIAIKNSEWTTLNPFNYINENYVPTPPSTSTGMTVTFDGEGNEWTDEYLKVEDNGTKIYYYEDTEFAYLYCTPADSTFQKKISVRYGETGDVYTIEYLQHTETYNGIWKSNDGTEVHPWATNSSSIGNNERLSRIGSVGIEFKLPLSYLDPSKTYNKVKVCIQETYWGNIKNNFVFDRN